LDVGLVRRNAHATCDKLSLIGCVLVHNLSLIENRRHAGRLQRNGDQTASIRPRA
jgi:hypothetical protein